MRSTNMMRGIVIVVLFAYTNAFFSSLPWSLRQSSGLIQCESDGVCTTNGNNNCACLSSAKICVDGLEVSKGLGNCPTCTTSSQCGGLDNQCNMTIPDLTTGTPGNTQGNTPSSGSSTVAPGGGTQGNTPSSGSSTVAPGGGGGIGGGGGGGNGGGTTGGITNVQPSPKPAAVNPQPKPVCVSTKWLKERNLQHATLRHFATPVDVLCIAGLGDLPCATPGHMLRVCTGGSCQLLTYREICDSRADCVASMMAVSQLSHTWDWAKHNGESSSIRFELTSVSASSHAQAPSRIIARVANKLNRAQLGHLCNLMVVLSFRAEATIRMMLLAAQHISS